MLQHHHLTLEDSACQFDERPSMGIFSKQTVKKMRMINMRISFCCISIFRLSIDPASRGAMLFYRSHAPADSRLRRLVRFYFNPTDAPSIRETERQCFC